MIPRDLQGAHRAAAEFWGIPVEKFLLNSNGSVRTVPRGLERVLLATGFVAPKVRRVLEELPPREWAAGFASKSLCQNEPIGRVICERPLLVDKAFLDDLRKKTLREAFEVVLAKNAQAGSSLNPIYRVYHRHLVEFTLDFCAMWEIKPGDTIIGWMFDRLRQPRYIQYANLPRESDRSIEDYDYAEVIALLPPVKQIWMMGDDWFSSEPPTSTRRSPGLERRIELQLASKLPKSKSAQKEKIIQKCGYSLAEAILADRTNGLVAGLSVSKSQNGRHRSVPDRGKYNCAVPTNGALGLGEIEYLIARSFEVLYDHHESRARQMDAVALLMGCATWHLPWELDANFKLDGFWVSSHLHKPTLYDGDQNFYEPIGSDFVRRIPSSLFPWFTHLRKDGFPDKDRVEKFIKSIRPYFSWTLTRNSLTNVCPDGYGFSAVLPHLGFNPDQGRGIPARAYTRVSREMILRCQSWMRLFDDDLTEEQYFARPGFRPCGSAGVPKVSKLRGLVAEMVKLATEKGMSSDLDDAVVQYNAVVACSHLFGPVALSGLRNWPIPLEMNSGLTDNCVYFEKEVGVYHAHPSFFKRCERLQKMLEHVIKRAEKQGVETNDFNLRMSFPSLIECTKKGLNPVQFSATAIVSSLMVCEATLPFVGGHSGMMRHFTTSVLAGAGFSMAEIETFHHRGLSALHVFAPHRLESVTPGSSFARMHQVIMTALGL